MIEINGKKFLNREEYLEEIMKIIKTMLEEMQTLLINVACFQESPSITRIQIVVEKEDNK